MPRKNVGADWPTRATPIVTWSIGELRLTAESRPTGTATSSGQAEGGECELGGGRQVAHHHAPGRLAEVNGATEVTAQDVADEHRVLHGQRAVETEILGDALVLAARGIRWDQQRHRITGQTHDHEDHGGDQPEGDERPEQPRAEEPDERAHDGAGAAGPRPVTYLTSASA